MEANTNVSHCVCIHNWSLLLQKFLCCCCKFYTLHTWKLIIATYCEVNFMDFSIPFSMYIVILFMPKVLLEKPAMDVCNHFLVTTESILTYMYLYLIVCSMQVLFCLFFPLFLIPLCNNGLSENRPLFSLLWHCGSIACAFRILYHHFHANSLVVVIQFFST